MKRTTEEDGTILHNMKNRLLNNWGWLRIVRLVIGAYVVYGGIQQIDYLMLFFGGLFLVQAVFNLGCRSCSSGNCEIDPEKLKESTDAN